MKLFGQFLTTGLRPFDGRLVFGQHVVVVVYLLNLTGILVAKPQQVFYRADSPWADYFSKLDALDNKTKADNRFKAEVWLLTKSRKPFSAFDTVADLYFVNITPDISSSERHSIWASFRFFCIYTFRKYQKKWFGYSYKKHCQERFQKLKAEVRTAPNR